MTTPQSALDQARLDAWMDGLDEDEREVARRLVFMPGGNHAVAWLGVEHHRTSRRMCEAVKDISSRLSALSNAIGQIQHNTNGDRRSAGVSGALIGGLLVGAAAAIAKLLGLA